ncbi:hypothetical protein BC628DRAFT_974282 [Trametes gibbosa]|nr:hypothetical protein BC628DRAFT_974282 [Trametes gibbosa]
MPVPLQLSPINTSTVAKEPFVNPPAKYCPPNLLLLIALRVDFIAFQPSYHRLSMDTFDLNLNISLICDEPLDDTIIDQIPINEDSASRAGVYCVIA